MDAAAYSACMHHMGIPDTSGGLIASLGMYFSRAMGHRNGTLREAGSYQSLVTCFGVGAFPSSECITHDILSDSQSSFLHEPFDVLSSFHVMMCEY